MVNFTGSIITEKTGLQACLCKTVQIRLSEVGLPTLDVSGAIPWAEVLHCPNKEKARGNIITHPHCFLCVGIV